MIPAVISYQKLLQELHFWQLAEIPGSLVSRGETWLPQRSQEVILYIFESAKTPHICTACRKPLGLLPFLHKVSMYVKRREDGVPTKAFLFRYHEVRGRGSPGGMQKCSLSLLFNSLPDKLSWHRWYSIRMSSSFIIVSLKLLQLIPKTSDLTVLFVPKTSSYCVFIYFPEI